MIDDLRLPEDWTPKQLELFTRVYRFMVLNPQPMVHPDVLISPEHWQTTAHNAAWIAAELLETDTVRVLDSDTQTTIARTFEGCQA